MGYRLEHHHPHGHRTMHDIATPMVVSVHNGSTAHLAVPAWYQEIQKPVRAKHHNIQWHNHVGWPSPDHPDHICQLAYEGRHYGSKCPIGFDRCRQTCSHYIDMSQVIPIHLLSEYEGYSPVGRVSVVDRPEGLSTKAWIDPLEDWVVRVTFAPLVEDAVSEPVLRHFTVFVDAPETVISKIDAKTGEEKTKVLPPRSDVAAHGLLQILPSEYK